MPTTRTSATALLFLAALGLPPCRAQEPGPAAAAGHIIRLAERPEAFEQLRALIRAGADQPRIDAVIEELDAWTRREALPVVRAAEALGARVREHYWILPGLLVDGLDARSVAALRDAPGVAAIHANAEAPLLNETARNAQHHRATEVEQITLPNGQRIDGSGVAIAILDTGADRDFAGTGLPHPAHYPGGDQSQTTGPGLDGSRLLAAYETAGFGAEDQHGHGAHVAGSAGSGAVGYRGIARASSIVSINIAHPPLWQAYAADTIAAWQLTLQTRVQHGTRVANNSYSGSPDLNDPTQVALDNAAYLGDLLICASAGNSGADTTRSQNCWNGLAVGNVTKGSFTRYSSSAIGPLASFGRSFPDIAAVGTAVLSTALDTATPVFGTGTSMASPMVAGAAALLFQARPDLSAIEAKAVLLGTTRHVQNAPNTHGRGVLDARAAVERALGGGVETLRFEPDEENLGFFHCVDEPKPVRVTAAWMHPGGPSFENVDLRVYDGGQVLAADLNALSSYEHVEFLAVPGHRYRIELSRPTPTSPSLLDVAVSVSDHDFGPDSPLRLSRRFHFAEIGTRLDKTIGSPSDLYYADLGRVELFADLSYTRTSDTFEMQEVGPVSLQPDSGIGSYSTAAGDGRIWMTPGGTRAGTMAVLDRSGTYAVFGRDDRPRAPFTGTRTPAESSLGIALPVSTQADDTLLAGTYHLLTKRLELVPEPVNNVRELHTATVLGSAVFDGMGAFTFSALEAAWDPHGGRSTANVAGQGTYAVQPDGSLSIGPDTEGAVSEDGSVFFLVTRGPGMFIELILGARRSNTVQIDDTTGPWSKFLHSIATSIPPTLGSQLVEVETAFENIETVRTSQNAGAWTSFETTVFHQNGSTAISSPSQAHTGTYTISPLGFGTAVFVGNGPSDQVRISEDATIAFATDQSVSAELGAAVHAPPCSFAALYGKASASPSNQPLGIGVADMPQLGNARFGVVVQGSTQQLASVVLSLAPAPGTPFFGAQLWADLQANLAMVAVGLPQSPGHNGGGLAKIPIPLPATPGLQGVTLYSQAIAVDLQAPSGIVSSAGLRFTFYR